MYLFKALTKFFSGSPVPKVPEPAPVKAEEIISKPVEQEPDPVPVTEATPVTTKVSKPRTTRPRGPGKPKKTATK